MTFDCQVCGACCIAPDKSPAYVPLLDKEAPMFDPSLVIRGESGYHYLRTYPDRRCRCLDGKPGESVTCTVYDQRPKVCREYEAGSVDCLEARRMEGIAT